MTANEQFFSFQIFQYFGYKKTIIFFGHIASAIFFLRSLWNSSFFRFVVISGCRKAIIFVFEIIEEFFRNSILEQILSSWLNFCLWNFYFFKSKLRFSGKIGKNWNFSYFWPKMRHVPNISISCRKKIFLTKIWALKFFLFD